MRRLLPLLGAVLVIALSFSSAAGADTFRVVRTSSGASAKAPQRLAPSTGVIPFTQQQNGPMSFAALRGIWQAAGARYGIPWEVLGAINKVETNFGQNLGPSSAGAIGWMQFMPSTWARWGTDANGDGVADPDNPTDAIFSAARYLAGCGGQLDIARAVYCYNHSQRYVNDVLGLAALYGRGGGGGVATGRFFTVDLRPQLASARHQIAASKGRRPTPAHERGSSRPPSAGSCVPPGPPTCSPTSSAAHKHAVLMAVRREAADRAREPAPEAVSTRPTRSSADLRDRGRQSRCSAATASRRSPDPTAASSRSRAVPRRPVRVGAARPASGFDCSGLVQYVFAQLGIALPHNAVAQFHSPAAVSVPRNQLQPGDLVFFNGLDHVGIYIGNGDFIDAPHTGTDVRIDSLRGRWAAANYDGAKRIVGASFGSEAGATMFAAHDTTSFTPDVVYFTH